MRNYKFHFLFTTIVLCLADLTRPIQADCGMVGFEKGHTNIHFDSIRESTNGNTVIVSQFLYNVSDEEILPTQFSKYLRTTRAFNGLYEFITESTFPNFITVERTKQLILETNFTCTTGLGKGFRFVFNIIDENNHGPEFFSNTSNIFNLSLPMAPGTVINTGILVSDLDLDLQNADVKFESTNKTFFPKVTKLSNGSSISGHVFKVDLIVDGLVTEGIYQTDIVATDGKFTNRLRVYLDIRTRNPELPEFDESCLKQFSIRLDAGDFFLKMLICRNGTRLA